MQTHHINYNKADSNVFNLLTLCDHCHKRTLSHKHDWLRLFNEVMTTRFGAEYRAYLKSIDKRVEPVKKYPGHYRNGPVTNIIPP